MRFFKLHSTKPVFIRLCFLSLISFSSQGFAQENNSSVRIVTLAPHLGELVEAAGAFNNLVGITSYTQLSKDHDIQIIGDAFKVDIERIISLKPDYILIWKGGTPLRVQQQLASLGFNIVETEINTLNDIPETILQISNLTHTKTFAQNSVNKFNLTLQTLKSKTSVHHSTFIETFHQPLYTVSGKHWMSEAAAVCGYDNIFSDLPQLSLPVTMESIVLKNPQAILNIAVKKDTQWQKWSSIEAVKNNNIITLSPEIFSHPNTNILEGMKELCEF